MATIIDIMNRVSKGDETYKFEKVQSAILEAYDADNDLMCTSQYIRDQNAKLFWEEDSRVARTLEKITVQFENAEKRLFDGKVITEAYKRMVSSFMVDNYKVIMEDMSSRIAWNKINDKERFSQILGMVQYATHKYINPRAVFVESTNPILNVSVKNSIKDIQDII